MARAKVKEYSVAIPEAVDNDLRAGFLRRGEQEDGGFGLWAPVYGETRTTAIMREWVTPDSGEVEHHGNITLSPEYYSRARELAREKGLGIVLVHSHPLAGGWPLPSTHDINNELGHLARDIYDVTGLPLVGLILSGDGTWGARFYDEDRRGKIRRYECTSVRSVGTLLKVSFNPTLRSPPKVTQTQVRTRTFWGNHRHQDIARLRVGVVGFGSVGSLVAEQLARIGVGELVITEFDLVEPHNLDRLIHATASDARRKTRKIDLARRWIPKAATTRGFKLEALNGSIVELHAYKRGLDCDVIFSCVDMNWPRQVLNHLAYTCAIPVVDGGVSIRVRPSGDLQHGVVRAQTVGIGRACLSCLGMYDAGRIQMERDGSIVDPAYIEKLGDADRLGLEMERQNIMPFAVLLSALEVSQFIELVTGMAGKGDFGRQQYDYSTGELLPDHLACLPDCEYTKMSSTGSRNLPVLGPDPQRRALQSRRT